MSGQRLTIPPDAVMTDFCYSFADGLLTALEKMIAQSTIFSRPDKGKNRLTELTRSVCNQLADQIDFDGFGEYAEESNVRLLAQTAREFLAIFQKP